MISRSDREDFFRLLRNTRPSRSQAAPETDTPILPDPAAETSHLLKVTQAVNKDAADTWAELWAQFKPFVTPSGVVLPQMSKGFVPPCGWAEFLEKFWLLKHYLDSVARVCGESHQQP